MSEKHEQYKAGLVAKLQKFAADRDAVREKGYDGYMADALVDGYPNTPQTRNWVRKVLATVLADLDYRIAQHRLSIELAEVAERHRDAIDTALTAHRRARAEQVEAATKLARQGSVAESQNEEYT